MSRVLAIEQTRSFNEKLYLDRINTQIQMNWERSAAGILFAGLRNRRQCFLGRNGLANGRSPADIFRKN